VYFKWNNSFSWLTSKLLSYSIRLSQPAFPIADQNRCQKSRAMLTTAIDEAKKVHSKLRKAKDKVKSINDDVYAAGIVILILSFVNDSIINSFSGNAQSKSFGVFSKPSTRRTWC